MRFTLNDFGRILGFLQESIDGVSWSTLAEVFSDQCSAAYVVCAADLLLDEGFVEVVRYSKPEPRMIRLPATIRATTDGLERFHARVNQAYMANETWLWDRYIDWQIEDLERHSRELMELCPSSENARKG